MSTRSRVGLLRDDGTVKSIYVHFDGYKEGVGKTLQKHYTKVEDIEKLLELGNLSVLGSEYNETLSKISWHRYDKDLSDEDKKLIEQVDSGSYTITYKDRSGQNEEARIDESLAEFVSKAGNCGEEYMYIFKPDYDGVRKWFMMEVPYFEPLEWLLEGK